MHKQDLTLIIYKACYPIKSNHSTKYLITSHFIFVCVFRGVQMKYARCLKKDDTLFMNNSIKTVIMVGNRPGDTSSNP